MLLAVGQRLHARSATLLVSLEQRLPTIMRCWLAMALGASVLRIATSPLQGAAPSLETILPYVLLIAAPFASMVLALRWFADGERQPQPTVRLAVVGRWRSVSLGQAQRHPFYGTTGFMVSLMIGMLLNIPVRALEYLTAVPAISGAVPEWLSVFHTMMTLDVVMLSSLYAICFVAALRKLPSFPRLLAATWVLDLVSQLSIAEAVARAPGLPVTVASTLLPFLDGNVHKVMISVALWLPYLLMSRRVNLTYRLRIPA